jgi:hypothetical protein
MLLLLVLLMLALFMGAGAMLLTVAARARASARANAAAITQWSQSDKAVRDALEEAILTVIRGSAITGTTGSVLFTGTSLYPPGESLLADKYGISLTGSSTKLSGTNSPVMSLSLQLSTTGTLKSGELNGRILTIVPQLGDGDIASYRILSFDSAGGNQCYVAQPPSVTPRQHPTKSFDIVINGREFTPVSGTTTPEPYDAFDSANGFLAQPMLANNQIDRFARVSFGTAAPAVPTVDNDNDGVFDGVWIPSVLPSGTAPTPPPYVIPDRPSPLGGTVRHQVSYLIMDLDGRINVNAAGMPSIPGVANPYGGTPPVNLGMGYGPADVDPSILFSGSVPSGADVSAFTGAATRPTGIWPNLLWSGTPSNPVNPTTAQVRQPPAVGAITGRYGPNGVPGLGDSANLTNKNDDGGAFSIVTGSALYPQLVAGNSVADLKGRSRVYLTAPASGEMIPAVNFLTPAAAVADWVDDPYELRLDDTAPRVSSPRRSAPTTPTTDNDDSPFTLAELERVLRPNDADATQLPSRLAAGLEDFAQRSRATITTDSWDSPAITGLAARQVQSYLAACPPLIYTGTAWTSGSSTGNAISPDVAAGLRFNLNRPVVSGSDAHEYCKGLYTLVMALSGTATPRPVSAAEAAQWAVNALDFRDADSNMTGFEYDINPFDGWGVDGDPGTTGDAQRAVVWGAERPDVVIAETAAWLDQAGTDGGIYVNLYRPGFTANLRTSSSGSAVVTGTTEKLPLALSGSTGLLRLSGTAVSAPSPWQIVFSAAGSSGTAQFTTNPTGGVLGSGSGTLAGPVELAPNGHLCVTSTSASAPYTIDPSVATLRIDGAFRFGTGALQGSVRLQRLANPAASFHAERNPYLTVDSGTVPLIAIRQPAPLPPWLPPPATFRRSGPGDGTAFRFWPQLFAPTLQTVIRPYVTGSTYVGTTVTTGTAPVPVIHWPNRPFISQAELSLVPTGTAGTGINQILASYTIPLLSLATSGSTIVVGSVGGTASGTASGTATLGHLILDATYVPSRFAGNAITVSGSVVDRFGLDVLASNQLSKWREPGRVNVNTIVSGTTSALDNIVWQTLIGGTTLAVASGSNSLASGTINPFTPSGTATVATPATSIGHLLSLSGSANQPLATGTSALSGTFAPRASQFFDASDVIRLANTATIRSNVFAVWVTVRITDDSPNAPSPVTKRAFAIIDRSVPVGYSPGKDLNVQDCIRVLRFLD